MPDTMLAAPPVTGERRTSPVLPGTSAVLRVETLWLAQVIVTVTLAFVLIWVHGMLPLRPVPSVDLIIEALRSNVAPKPTERFVFAVLAALTLPLAVLFSRGLPRLTVSRGHATAIAVPLAVAGVLLAAFVRSDMLVILLEGYDPLSKATGDAALAVALAASVLWCVALVRLRPPARWVRLGRPVAWTAFALCALLQLLAWRLVHFGFVTRSGEWSTHADPVFFVVSQVVGGRTLLVDLPSQYGLFPEMIAPFFRQVGLSVLKLGTFFAALQLASMAALFAVLARTLRSRTLLLVTGLALVLVTFETTLFLSHYMERYYQYWPIRFLWPALSVYVFHRFARRRTLARAAAMSLLGAAGLIWNIDSGLFIAVGFGAYLATRLLLRSTGAPDRWTARRYAAALSIHAAVTMAVPAAFLLALAWKAGAPLNTDWLFAYQKIFIDLGLMLLPMPRALHPWMAVLGVYVAGILVALDGWRGRGAHIRADLMFYLGMLGIGLFVYYAGRSHVLNLITVCWPAVLLTALLADGLLCAVRLRLLPRAQLILPVAGGAVLLVAAGSLVAHVPFLAGETRAQVGRWTQVADPFVATELALIRTHADRRDCLILSQRQGLYYAEAGMVSPLRGPGLVETLLQSDMDAQVAALLDGKLPCVFLGIGPFSDPGMHLTAEAVQAAYVNVAANPESTMMLLRPRPR